MVDKWAILFEEITEAFSPGAPIRERDLFAGRLPQIGLLVDAVRQRGRHAIMFGERGVGKTSLANIFAVGMHSPTNLVIAEKINADPTDSFSSLWRKVFKRISYRVEQNDIEVRRFISDDYPGDISPDDVQIELSNFTENTTPIIIIDEFDRIHDRQLPLLMADTIKALSDYSVHCTVVIVGVADDISYLIKNHASISRQLVQVRMPRMSREELAKIITDRLARLDMKIEEETLWRATFLSRGLPYFTHLLGMHSARSAVQKKQMNVSDAHLDEGIKLALEEVDQSLREAHMTAVVSQRPRETLYEPILIACALQEGDDLGRFQQKDIEEALAGIAGKRYKATTYAFHMNEFTTEKRGSILERSGEEGNPRYRFREPMMQPYVLMRGHATGRIDKDFSEKFIPQRQPRLSSDF